MKAFLAAAAIGAVTASAASASGPVAPPPPAPPYIAPVVSYDWSGFYAGIYVGVARGNGYDVGGPAFPYPLASSSSFGGVFGGYRHDMGSVVIGGEVATTLVNNIVQDCCAGWEFDRMTDFRVTVGREFGRALVYGSAGYTISTFVPGAPPSQNYNGWNIGLGVDVMINSRVFVGAEYVYRDLSSTSTPGWGAQFGAVQLRAGLRF